MRGNQWISCGCKLGRSLFPDQVVRGFLPHILGYTGWALLLVGAIPGCLANYHTRRYGG